MVQPRRKFGNKPTTLDNIRFDSQLEAARYLELKILLYQGLIANLRIHPPYPLIVNGCKVATYKADFAYTLVSSGQEIVEDVKVSATKTAVYRLKARLLFACQGIRIVEV